MKHYRIDSNQSKYVSCGCLKKTVLYWALRRFPKNEKYVRRAIRPSARPHPIIRLTLDGFLKKTLIENF